ncbi:MAG: outer membrane lipoprotein-sorting protein [Nitrospirales bacterium]
MREKKRIRFITIMTTFFILLIPGLSNTQEKLSGEEIIKKSQEIFYYAGKDLKTKILMKLISKNGKERIRELTMLRLNKGESGEQKYYMYFHRPADVREMTFMIWKYLGKNDDRWLYVPTIKLVRRIAANDKNSSFVGSDFTYEDVSGREVLEDTHTLKREETLNGKSMYVVKSVPKDERSAFYSRKVSWIDQETFLPLKEEYYDKRGNLYKIFTADKIETIQGIATITQRTMANIQNGHHTVVTFEDVSYNIGLKEDIFSERYLRSAPRQWIK